MSRDARLHIRIKAELLEDVKKRAEARGVSVASVVNTLLETWVTEEHVKQGLQFSETE